MFNPIKNFYTNQIKPRLDTFRNVLTGYGEAKSDKSANYSIVPSRPMSYQELDTFFRENSIAKKICVKPAEEMTKNELVIKSEKAADYTLKLRNMNIYEKMKLALVWENAFGGALIILDIQDGQDLEEPVDESRIVAVGDRVIVLDRSVIRFNNYNPYGENELFNITLPGETLHVHASRCLLFDGAGIATLSERIEHQGFADPILKRLRKAIENFTVAQGTCGQILADFSQSVYKIEGLNDDLESEDGEMHVTKRLLTMDRSRSIIRAVVLDKEDDFIREVAPVQGIKEFVSIFADFLTSVTDMPHNILHGESPGASMGESGQGQFIAWYDYITHQRNIRLYKKYKTILKYEALANNDTEPDFDFPNLWELDEKEKAELKSKYADSIYKIATSLRILIGNKNLMSDEMGTELRNALISDDSEKSIIKIFDILRKVSETQPTNTPIAA